MVWSRVTEMQPCTPSSLEKSLFSWSSPVVWQVRLKVTVPLE